MKDFEEPVIVELPLRGEWMTPNTPGKKVPSHGTNLLGERYAFDFVQVDHKRKGNPFYYTSTLRYLFLGVPLDKTYGWGKEVHAPCDGEIIVAEDGYQERSRAHVVPDFFIRLKNAYSYRPFKDGIQAVAGNYIVMKCHNDIYAGLAHLKRGSITVAAGQRVKRGAVLGEVGHSGNSTAPHLHFQLMDSSNLFSAKGLPCAFESYEIFRDGEWETIYKGVPSDKDRIRFRR
ncbi:M23 family metallopeptidase [Thalassobacillus pellis]|uniref:M23 family metallopeptidase n=1 Tax=Thalassobacillus pellis TaxID=748008 RepID=UPI00196159AA|nr:M23 family metallopeptidase [Thalassobacillus pellis]MBM7551411.1 murein DD-endopeptidase MepM/ murein hydrolase activator NlpD [Thalassobacillus pellis]